MNDLLQVLVPLVNPNEPESLLVDLSVTEGQKVAKGQIMAVFETTKSTFELSADGDGYILGLKFKTGDAVRSGERLCYLAPTPDSILPAEAPVSHELTPRQAEEIPAELLITAPALKSARERGIDLDSLPKGILITEKILNEMGAGEEMQAGLDPTLLVVYGGGGHAKSLIDLIRLDGRYQVHGILDDGIPAGDNIMGIPVLGGGELLPALRRKGVGLAINAVGGIGSIHPRLAVYQKLEQAGFLCVTVAHPLSFIEASAELEQGCQVFCHAYIGSETHVGFGSIINTGAIISHDCVLGKFVNISPGAILAGSVTVEERALVGMGVTINLGVRIGAGARIGNSAVVKGDVPENGIVRAGSIWPLE